MKYQHIAANTTEASGQYRTNNLWHTQPWHQRVCAFREEIKWWQLSEWWGFIGDSTKLYWRYRRQVKNHLIFHTSFNPNSHIPNRNNENFSHTHNLEILKFWCSLTSPSQKMQVWNFDRIIWSKFDDVSVLGRLIFAWNILANFG